MKVGINRYVTKCPVRYEIYNLLFYIVWVYRMLSGADSFGWIAFPLGRRGTVGYCG